MIDKNLKVLDLADGVEKLANISSFDVNSTITDSDLMLIEQSTALKKVTIGDLKTEFGGGGEVGNYNVLRVEFSANSDFETTTILPVGSQIDRLVIRSNGLTNGIDPLTFKINGTTPVVLATQGIEFDNTAGRFNIIIFEDDVMLILASGENGTFMAEWAGAGYGTGTGEAYLFYWTPKP